MAAGARLAGPPGFALSSDRVEAAKAAAPGSSASFWSHKLYERVAADGAAEKVKVRYCTSKHAMERVCQQHFVGHEVLGLDLEWSSYATRQSGPRENVSLIQLASPSRIGLFQVAVFAADDLVAPTFRAIMEDAGVIKAGVNVRGDCTRLNNCLGVTVRGIFELSHMYKQVKYSAAGTPGLINKSSVPMSVQVHEYLGLPLLKETQVRMSNWRRPLTSSQILCMPTTHNRARLRRTDAPLTAPQMPPPTPTPACSSSMRSTPSARSSGRARRGLTTPSWACRSLMWLRPQMRT